MILMIKDKQFPEIVGYWRHSSSLTLSHKRDPEATVRGLGSILCKSQG